jgi:hypothetical protein
VPVPDGEVVNVSQAWSLVAIQVIDWLLAMICTELAVPPEAAFAVVGLREMSAWSNRALARPSASARRQLRFRR